MGTYQYGGGIVERLEHIGERIRLFRKHQNLTLEELAYLVHKSPSTLSKYERGSVNIDILTLADIADALGVGMSQLTDFRTVRHPRPARNDANLFRRHDKFFVYYLHPPMNTVLRGILEVTRSSVDDIEDSVMLYLWPEKEFGIKDPLFIFTGTMICDEYYAYMSMQNASGMRDMLYLMIKTPQWMLNGAKGILLSVSSAYGVPASSTVLLSADELEIDEMLLEQLRADKDEVIEFARQTNLFAPL